MSDEVFNFVIAGYWPGTKNFCIYTYGSEIQEGTIKGAKNLLEHVQFMTRNDEDKDYKIYKVNYEPLEI